MVQRFVVLGDEKAIIEELNSMMKDGFIPGDKKAAPTKKSWPSFKEVHYEAIKKAESEMIVKALEMTKWNRKKAADLLNISYKALLYKIKECRLDKPVAHPGP